MEYHSLRYWMEKLQYSLVMAAAAEANGNLEEAHRELAILGHQVMSARIDCALAEQARERQSLDAAA